MVLLRDCEIFANLCLKLYMKVWSNAKCSETVSKLCGTWKDSACAGSGNVTIDDRYQTFELLIP